MNLALKSFIYNDFIIKHYCILDSYNYYRSLY